MNTNEKVKVVFNAVPISREICDMVGEVACQMVDTGCPMPEELEDVFDIEIFTRPSGTRYAIVNFA